jgi:hypothetical protein
MTWQRNLNNVDSHKSLIRANVFFAVCAECFPLGVDSRWSLAGPTNLVTFTAQKFRDTFAVFEGSLGKTCSWRPLLRRCVSTCAQCLALELCTIFVAWNFQGAFLCKTFATFSFACMAGVVFCTRCENASRLGSRWGHFCDFLWQA